MPPHETKDITGVMDDAAIQRIHITVLLISVLVALVDGFDNQTLAFTAPAMAIDWGIQTADFAVAFSSGLAGMMFGSVLFGEIADRFGRRVVFVWATCLFGVVTLMMPFSRDVTQLTILRFIAGLGLGGLPTVMASLVSEYTPKTLRATFGNWAFIGLPAGGFVGGLSASYIIPNHGWEAVYFIGGVATLCVALAAALCLPESPSFLLRRRNDQARVRGILTRIAPEAVFPANTTLVAQADQGVETSILSAFRDGRALMTLLFWLAEIILLMGYYLMVNWTPTLLIRAGLSMQTAMLGSVALNVGGIVCGLLVGRLCDRLGARRVVSAVFLLGAVSLLIATQAGGNVPILMIAIFLAGAAFIGGQGAIVVLIANSYPASIRSISVGWALTVGRIGAIASPAVVSIPLGWGWQASEILLLPILPTAIGALAVFFAQPGARTGLAATLPATVDTRKATS